MIWGHEHAIPGLKIDVLPIPMWDPSEFLRLEFKVEL